MNKLLQGNNYEV